MGAFLYHIQGGGGQWMRSSVLPSLSTNIDHPVFPEFPSGTQSRLVDILHKSSILFASPDSLGSCNPWSCGWLEADCATSFPIWGTFGAEAPQRLLEFFDYPRERDPKVRCSAYLVSQHINLWTSPNKVSPDNVASCTPCH